MKTETPQDLMMKYLLDELPASEQQAFEEKFFADEEVFSELLAVENDLVDSFVNGVVNGEEQTRFEKKFLTTAVGRRKVENAQALKRFISSQPAMLREKERQKAKPRSWHVLLEPFGPQSQAFRFALTVAVIVLAIGIGWLVYQSSALRDQLRVAQNDARLKQLELDLEAAQRQERESQDRLAKESGQSEELAEQLRQETERVEQLERELANARQRAPSILTATVAPGLTRGGAEPTKIVVPSGTEVVRLHLPLPSDKTHYKNYSATLSEGSGRQVLTHKNVKPETTAAGQALIARLSPRVLQDNNYVFHVKGETREGRTESVETYPFSVIKQ